MTREGWKEAILKASREDQMMDLLSQLLEEQDSAKNALREKGYGVTGSPWPEVVAEIPRRDA